MLRAVFALALVAVAAPNSIGEGVCGNPSCSPMRATSDACNTAPSGAWDANTNTNTHDVTTLALCVALAKARPANNKKGQHLAVYAARSNPPQLSQSRPRVSLALR